MSYQVLARKWRPHTFEQVVGQQHVLTALTNALDQGRLHHAYLLSGTRGVGKTTIARILAKSLNCEQGISSHPCGVCDTCREIDQGNFVDLLEIDAASRTKVEDTRELLDNVQYRPARGRFKVYLIDEVHMLSRHSFNALLKTLEEPPPYVKFLLATTDPQKLPITILSRCLQFHLKSLDQTQIARQLEWVLDQEGQPFEPRALLALAKAADGSMRDALSLTDQALAHGNGSVRLESVLTMLGTLDHHHLHQLLEAVLRQDAPATMAKITEIATLGPDFDQLHAELEALLHRVAMAQLLPASVQEQGADADALLQLAGAMSPEEVQLCYQIVLGGRKDLPWAPDGRTALEMTCLRMLAFSPRREVVHPANLAAQPLMTGHTGVMAAARESAPLLPGKPQGAEPAPAASAAPKAPAAPASVLEAEHVATSLKAEEGAVLDPLFAEQDELLREAERMGYEAVVPASPPTEPASAPLAADDAGQTQQVEVQGEDVAISSTSSMQSLLGKRNLLRSRLRGEQSANAVPARITPVKSVAATKPAPAMPAVATSPQAEVQPAARPEMPGQGPALQTGPSYAYQSTTYAPPSMTTPYVMPAQPYPNAYASTTMPAMAPSDPLAAYRMHQPPAMPEERSYSLRESHALREHSFIQNTEHQLDAFIAQGRSMLGNLVEQRSIFKQTRKRLLDAANTVGLSRELIGVIDRMSTQDTILFFVGATITLVIFYLIYRYLG